jgi:hypothetical protein
MNLADRQLADTVEKVTALELWNRNRKVTIVAGNSAMVAALHFAQLDRAARRE